jgi:hypothetical protein
MERLEGFIDAPQVPLFFNPVPSGGFRLIEACSPVPFSSIFPVTGGEKVFMTAYPRKEECSEEAAEKFHPLLLLPVGPHREAINGYHSFFNEQEPLFQQFAKLETDNDILAFAGKFGQLKQGVTSKPIEGRVFLESLNLWKGEISLVRRFLQIFGDFEMGQNLGKYLKYMEGEILFMVHGEKRIAGKNIFLTIKPAETVKDTVYRGMATFLDEKLREAPLTVSHGWGDGKVRSYLTPLSLQGALWLQLSQAFFQDGPTEAKVRRCVLTGDYFRVENDAKEKIMWLKKTGPLKGHYYHKDMADRFTEQKRKRDKAAREGKTVKEGRKGATKFLVGFDEFWGTKKDAPDRSGSVKC